MNIPLIIAGPCAIESEKQAVDIAKQLSELGITHFRGGAFKPRTSPQSFQGLGLDGLKILATVKKLFNIKIVTELVSIEDIKDIVEVADIIQIGARNMQNFDLLKKAGSMASNTPILLKRGISSTKKELLGAIEYLNAYGHKSEIIICERGIRTFANGDYDRFTLDTGLIADLKTDQNFKHKILVDPSHPAGRPDIVDRLTFAGIAAGADGYIVEVKLDETSQPKCDADQAITIEQFKKIQKKANILYNEVNKK